MAIFLIKVQPAVRKETLRIAAGTAVLTAVMLVVFALLGKFDLSVLLGAILGYAAAGALREVPKPVYSDEDIAFYSKISASFMRLENEPHAVHFLF